MCDLPMHKTKAYQRYRGMISRCHFAKSGSLAWRNYQGRGIAVCERWRFGEGGLSGFQCFIADVGEPPVGLREHIVTHPTQAALVRFVSTFATPA